MEQVRLIYSHRYSAKVNMGVLLRVGSRRHNSTYSVYLSRTKWIQSRLVGACRSQSRAITLSAGITYNDSNCFKIRLAQSIVIFEQRAFYPDGRLTGDLTQNIQR